MTQPPDEPTPDDAWQPPGPQPPPPPAPPGQYPGHGPPYDPPPPGQNPYGGDTPRENTIAAKTHRKNPAKTPITTPRTTLTVEDIPPESMGW